MTVVAYQIGLWILIAALFGFAIGWVARARRVTPPRKKRRRFPK